MRIALRRNCLKRLTNRKWAAKLTSYSGSDFCLDTMTVKWENHFSAEVAELVDAPGSGSGGRKPVGVRVSSSAPA